MLVVKFRDIYNVIASGAFGRLGEKNIPIKVAYQIHKMVRKLGTEHSFVEQKRSEMVARYNKEVSESGVEVIRKSEQSAFLKEFGAVLNETVELELDRINMCGVTSFDDFQITTNDLDLLIPFVKFLEEEDDRKTD